MIIKSWSAHSAAAARLTNMNFLLFLCLVFGSTSLNLVQANTDVLNSQNVKYEARSHELDPEILEEIFPEDYIKAHLGVKSDDEVREDLQHEVSGGDARDRGVHTWIGVFFLFTLLLWL